MLSKTRLRFFGAIETGEMFPLSMGTKSREVVFSLTELASRQV